MTWWEKAIPELKTAVDRAKNSKNADIGKTCIHGEIDCVRCAGEDLDSQQKTHGWERLEDADLKRIVYSLPEKIIDILKHNPGDAVIAGGYVRAMVQGEHVHDIDIFVHGEKDAKEILDDVNLGYEKKEKLLQIDDKKITVETQVSWHYPYKHPHEILEQFDYTVAKGAVWFEAGDKETEAGFKSICHERFYRDLARKMLVKDVDDRPEGLESIPRLLKYTGYGYSVEPATLAQIVTETCLSLNLDNGFEGVKKQLEEFYKPAGQGKNWADINKKYVKPKPKPKPPERSYDYSSGS